jgi:DNA-binding response OmpR family regulator
VSQILIVEDDVEMARLVKGMLAADGHVIRVCADGNVALDALATPVDLLLLDVNVPGRSGIEVCRAVRERETGGHRTTIVMITGQHDTASKLLAFSVGADDYLVKPIDVRELRSRVTRWVDRRAEQQGLVMRRRRDAIQEIVTTICHRVNNPLTSALMAVDIVLQRGTASAEDRADLALVRTQLLRITEFVAALEEVEDRTVPYLGEHQMIDVAGDSDSDSDSAKD